MARRLGIAGLALLAGGVLAAGALRLFWAETVLQVGFLADPAVVALLIGLVLALLVLAAAALARWQQRQLDAALAKANGAQEVERRRFIQRLDHELKNPLTAIQVHLDNLQEVAPSGERTAEAVSDVRAQVGRLTHLTRGLRRLADLEMRPLEIETVDVEELLSEVIELLEVPDRIQLDVQRVPWPIPSIQADRELLLIVFRNLVDNALKYSSAAVQVRARHTAGHLVVEVIDTGRGIAPDELPLVTGELYRGTNARDVAGSGLGLAIVERILERHGGRLEVRSRVGQGTITTATLPYVQAAPR